jgi:glycosyl transferase family 1
MRLVFVYWAFEDQGSGLIIQGYSEAARRLGHEVVVYGRSNPKIPLDYSRSIDPADAVIFIFEWTTNLWQADALDLLRLVSKVPRHRRVILDGDGNYNEMIQVDGDWNHRSEAGSRRWTEICDSLTDKICQPTVLPIRKNVRPFLFYSYNPAWEQPLDFRQKDYGMLYVGHSKFRWRPLSRVFQAIEPIREHLGGLGLVGYGWGAPPPWARPMQLEEAYYSDVAYLARLGVDILDPVPFERVITSMSRAVINPVVSRPTFSAMRFVTPRFFETPAASTIPVFGLEEAHVEEIYGPAARELVLREEASARLLDIVQHPEHYAALVQQIRRQLTERHTQARRLEELLEIVES